MLHPTQAVTLLREDFKAKAERIKTFIKLKFFVLKPSCGIIRGSILRNLKI